MRAALHAEWTKLSTVPDMAVSLACTVALLLLGGELLGQAGAAVLGVQAVAGEHDSGLLRPTLLAMPRRLQVYAAKAALLLASVAGAAVVAGATGSIPLLCLVAVLGLGAGAAVRTTTAAAALVLGLVLLVPALLHVFPDPDWQDALYRWSPTTAALSDATGVGDGLGVTAAWAAASAAWGAYLLCRRDA